MEHLPEIGAPDWGLTDDDPTVDVTEIKFGDGYTLRQPNGINYIRDKWNLGWSSLDRETAEATYQWLRARKSIRAFKWTHPISGEVHQVVCKSVSLTHANFNDHELRTTFEKDFNPV